jgi:hypothetical protein
VWQAVHDESALGAIGVLTIATRGAGGPGEVMLKVRGGTEAYIAWSERRLPRGTQVLAVTVRGARTVDVVPWPEDPLDAPGSTGLS